MVDAPMGSWADSIDSMSMPRMFMAKETILSTLMFVSTHFERLSTRAGNWVTSCASTPLAMALMRLRWLSVRW